jgi:LuxR family maltose regulon positive regulatory protein
MWQADPGSNASPVAWVSLDAGDNNPLCFWTYVTTAINTLYAHVGDTTLAMLNSPQSPAMVSVLTPLLNALADNPRDAVLILDDYHVIEVELIHQALAFLLDHLPPCLHLILATRTDPSLPLARLRGRGQLTELRTADLRFTDEEATTFLTEVMALPVPTEHIVALEKRTEGWIAGLQLAALAMRDRPDPASFIATFTGSNRYVADYLVEEVLLQQSEDVQRFLSHTCLLDRLSGPLCDAIQGSEGSQTMLEALERANLFVVSLDDERGWYRYHHLFADVLRKLLRQTQPELLPELHHRASAWYQQHSLPIEAVQHALAVPDFEHAADLIEQYSIGVFGWGQAHTVLGWLKSLPEALVRKRPFLCVIHAVMLTVTSQLEAAEARLQDAGHCLEADDTPVEQVRTIQGQVAVLRGNIVRFTGDIARHVVLVHQALALLLEKDLLWRVAAMMYAADAYLVSGDVSPANEDLLAAVVAGARSSGHAFLLLISLDRQARLYLLQGKLRRAESIYGQTVQEIGQEVLQVLPGSPGYYFSLSNLVREGNRLEEAERLLLQGMELLSGPLMTSGDDVLLGYTALARLQQARGDYSSAVSTLDTFMQIAGQRRFVPWLVAYAQALRAQIELAGGNLAAASQWAEQCGLSLEEAQPSYLHEQEYLTLVRVRVAQRREFPIRQDSSYTQPVLVQVLDLLERLCKQAEHNARMNSVIELLILQALALQVQGKRASALKTLERVLVLAEPEGYMRVFLDEGAPLIALLRQASAHGIAASYLQRLLAASGEQAEADDLQQATHTEPLLEPLTPREREVLHLLMQGASNRQMAQDLAVSEGTIKKYVYAICGKLGVQSRTQAVIKASTLNLR